MRDTEIHIRFGTSQSQKRAKQLRKDNKAIKRSNNAIHKILGSPSALDSLGIEKTRFD